MSTYTVKSGDSLSKIAAALKIKGGWRDLYNQNKATISNPNYIKVGQQINYGPASTPSSSSKTTTKSTLTPSQSLGESLAKTIEDPTRESFMKKYGMVEDLRPDAMFRAFANERNNPEANRLATQGMIGYDRTFARGGGNRSVSMQADRQNQINAYERQRQEMNNQYVQSQNDLFNTWYDKEMANYTTSKVPSDYQLSKFGIELPSSMNQGGYDSTAQYGYQDPVNFTNQFNYGGYKAPSSMYGSPYQVGGANDPSTSGYQWTPSGGASQVTQPSYKLF